MNVISPRLLPVLLFAFALAFVPSPPQSQAAFGPPVLNCGKFKKPQAKKSCRKKNSATKKAFRAVADANFSGTHAGGTHVDATFCRSGKWRIDVTVPGLDTQIFRGARWKIENVTVKPKAIYLNAIGPSRNVFTDVGLQKRGKTWYLAEGNPTLSAPLAIRTSAASDCRNQL